MTEGVLGLARSIKLTSFTADLPGALLVRFVVPTISIDLDRIDPI